MKKLINPILSNIIIVVLSVVLFNACSQNSEMPVKSEQEFSFNEANSAPHSDFRSILNSDNELSDMVFFPEKHSLEEFDKYYRTNIYSNEREMDNYDLKNVFFSLLDQSYDLANEADKLTLEFYLKEMDELPFLNTTSTICYMKVLKSLKDKYGMSKEDIKEHAKNRLAKSKEHINRNYTKNLAAREELLKGQNILSIFE